MIMIRQRVGRQVLIYWKHWTKTRHESGQKWKKTLWWRCSYKWILFWTSHSAPKWRSDETLLPPSITTYSAKGRWEAKLTEPIEHLTTDGHCNVHLYCHPCNVWLTSSINFSPCITSKLNQVGGCTKKFILSTSDGFQWARTVSRELFHFVPTLAFTPKKKEAR